MVSNSDVAVAGGLGIAADFLTVGFSFSTISTYDRRNVALPVALTRGR